MLVLGFCLRLLNILEVDVVYEIAKLIKQHVSEINLQKDCLVIDKSGHFDIFIWVIYKHYVAGIW